MRWALVRTLAGWLLVLAGIGMAGQSGPLGRECGPSLWPKARPERKQARDGAARARMQHLGRRCGRPSPTQIFPDAIDLGKGLAEDAIGIAQRARLPHKMRRPTQKGTQHPNTICTHHAGAVSGPLGVSVAVESNSCAALRAACVTVSPANIRAISSTRSWASSGTTLLVVTLDVTDFSTRQ